MFKLNCTTLAIEVNETNYKSYTQHIIKEEKFACWDFSTLKRCMQLIHENMVLKIVYVGPNQPLNTRFVMNF